MDSIRRGEWQARDGSLLKVKLLDQGDIAALQRFNAGLSERTRGVFLPHAYDESTLARYVERNRQGHDLIYVLRRGEDVVGYFFLWEFDQPVPLVGLGLADAWQGQWLGEGMLRLLIEDARDSDHDGLDLTTVPGNERAMRLCVRLGFQLVGEVENVAGDGRVVREQRMFLALKPDVQAPIRNFKPPVG